MPELATALLAVLVLVGASVLAFRHDQRVARARAAFAAAPWQVAEHAEGGQTVVYVHQPAAPDSRIVIDTIPDSDLPHWRERLLDARAEAQERAAVLNAGH
jgi:hypothetical protein